MKFLSWLCVFVLSWALSCQATERTRLAVLTDIGGDPEQVWQGDKESLVPDPD